MGGRADWMGMGTSFSSRRWLSLDPCGLLGVSCSFFVHFYAFGVSSKFLIEDSFFATAVFLLMYTPATIMALASLFMAWTTDPGAVPMGARPLVTVKRASSGEISPVPDNQRRRATRRCHKCEENYKAPRAHHDSVTGRCIVKFDHFCPWVGNAVGALNHKFFVLFIFYTMISCILCLFLLVIRMIHCGYGIDSSSDSVEANPQKSAKDDFVETSDETTASTIEDPNRFLMRDLLTEYKMECAGWYESMAVLILFIVTVIFLVFTCVMLFDQYEAIQTNASKIARMKMRVGQAGTELSRVTEEFNEMFGGQDNHVSWHWFVPFPVEFPRGMGKVVLGYEWDETFDPIPYDEGSSRENDDGINDPHVNSRIELTPQNSGSQLHGTKITTPRGDVEAGLKRPPTDMGEEDSFTASPAGVKDQHNHELKRRNSNRTLD